MILFRPLNEDSAPLAEAFGEVEALYHAMTQIVHPDRRLPRRSVTVQFAYCEDGSLREIVVAPVEPEVERV